MNKMLVLLNRLDTVEDYVPQIKEITKTHEINKAYLARVSRGFGSRVRSRVAPHKLEQAVQMSNTAAGNYLSKIAEDLGKEGIHVEAVTPSLPTAEIDKFIEENDIDLVVASNGLSGLCCWSSRGLTGRHVQYLCEHLFTKE